VGCFKASPPVAGVSRPTEAARPHSTTASSFHHYAPAKKLEGVERGLVLDLRSSFGLVEEELGLRVIAKAGEVHRGAA
jgi:hypothetical protein